MWIFLALLSAVLLGVYDIFKKISLRENAVIPVLFLSILTSSIILLPIHLLSVFAPDTTSVFYVPAVDFRTHLLILLKSVIVLASWLFAYFAVKHLPITIASPVKATQPMWTVVGALLIFGERLSGFQAAGVAVILLSFYLFSVAGAREGFSLKNKWIWFIVLATLSGSASGLFDKYLMREFPRFTVQVYYTYYQAILMLIITLALWYPKRKSSTPFRWWWSIALISFFLVTADFCYFYALSMDGSLIAVISTLRRSGVVIPFLFGALYYREKNLKFKMIPLVGILIGILFLFLGKD
ncbi:MAG: DMT family transporter [Prevotellaceae bacterium]|jgi:transporter family protein|nr:DMT family transporter [Prevotellaceae bacterium]